MGGLCGCFSSNNDIIGFWRTIELRKITFDTYQKIYEKNQRKWLASGDNKRSVDIRKCDELFTLLDSPDFSEKQRLIYFDKLNDYINDQSDKLTFFTSLSFFTKLTTEKDNKSKDQLADNIIDNLKPKENIKEHEIIFSNLIRMAIKRSDHDDVTKFFIEFVTEFPLQFLIIDKKDIEERTQVYSLANRNKLFDQIKSMDNKKFYDYMFNRENVSLIHEDLMKIQMEGSTGGLINKKNSTDSKPKNSNVNANGK